MNYKSFEDWFNEIENFSTRGERFFEELSYMTPQRAEEWLRAAWSCALNEGEENVS